MAVTLRVLDAAAVAPPAPTARWEDLFTPEQTARIKAEFERGWELLNRNVWDPKARKWVPRRQGSDA